MSRKRINPRKALSEGIKYFLLTIGGAVMTIPYLWMLSTSFKQAGTWYNMTLLPEVFSLEHYIRLLSSTQLPLWYVNTFIVAIITTASVAITSSLAGFAFAKYSFKGKELIFMLIISCMIIPNEMLIIPWYTSIAKLKLIDSLAGIISPGLCSIFGIFVMRQFISGIPNELLDAARVDGMSEPGIFWKIILPMAKPATAVVSIFTFLGAWNDFLWPLIVTNSEKMLTIQVGLSRMNATETGADWGGTLAGAALASIPMLIVFLIFQKQIIKGISITGLKG